MINQITQIRMPNGETIAIEDWSNRPLYSTADVLGGFVDTELYAFTYTEGDPVQSSGNITTSRLATLMDTNLDQAGEMAAVEEFMVFGVAIEVMQMTGSATAITNENLPAPGAPIPRAGVLATLQRRLIGALEVSEKDAIVAPIGFFPAGFGPAFSIFAGVGAGSTVRTAANNGDPGHHAELNLQVPVHIGGTEKFKFIFYNPTGEAVTLALDTGATDATCRVSLRVFLNGLHKRPVG